jgi:hypothetical protein
MFFIDRYFKTLKFFVQQQSHLKGSMVEGYFMQKIMGLCHDVIGKLDGYVFWAWKDEQDPCTIDNSFYKSHTNLIPSFFTYLYFIFFFSILDLIF